MIPPERVKTLRPGWNPPQWLGQGRTGVDGEGLCCSWGPCVSPWIWMHPKQEAGCLVGLAWLRGVWANTPALAQPRDLPPSCEPGKVGVN